MYAIIETGGKQYKVEEGDVIKVEKLGVEDMQPVITGKKTYIAPFVNAEKPQYLVIEDGFPNGRPALEKGFGVYMADRNTVNLSERMKVTVCLNPVHSATGPLGVVAGKSRGFCAGIENTLPKGSQFN